MRKTKQKILLLFFFNIILLTSCSIEEDYVEKNNFKNNKISFRYLKGNEAMQKINLLENRLTSSSKFRLNNRQSQFSRVTNETIDYSKVLEVIDTSGVINYSYKVVNHPEDNETTFHNLVLTNDPYGNLKISLIKYQSENVYASIGQFHGTITTKSLIDDTNPCDNSTVGANFYTGVIGGTDGGTDIVLPPNPNDNNNNNPPFNIGSGGGGNSGNSLSDLADVTFICNSCNFASNSWAGFNGHRDGDGVIYPFTIIINRGHNRITNNEVENPCDNNGFIGIINDSIISNPCNKIKEKTSSADYKQRFKNLNKPEKFNLPTESGFAQKNDGTFVDLAPIGNNKLAIPPNSVNVTHVHQNMPKTYDDGVPYDGRIKIHSVGDLENLIKTLQDNSTNPLDAFNVMISNEGIFAISIIEPFVWTSDLDEKLEKFNEYYLFKCKELLNDYPNTSPTYRKNYLQKMFLRGLIDAGLSDNIALFEGTVTNNNAANINDYKINWTLKTLESGFLGNSVKSNPCN